MGRVVTRYLLPKPPRFREGAVHVSYVLLYKYYSSTRKDGLKKKKDNGPCYAHQWVPFPETTVRTTDATSPFDAYDIICGKKPPPHCSMRDEL